MVTTVMAAAAARKTSTSSPQPPPPPPPRQDDADDAKDEDADASPPLLELSPRRAAQVWRDSSLLRVARAARREIDLLFADPRALDTRRLLDSFVVPDQYNLLRTQPAVLLGETLARQTADALALFGEAHLGLRAISPPWISFYLDHMGQELHVDGFQGPLAFVLPLSFWGDESDDEDEEEGEDAKRQRRRPRVFTGGETAILRAGTLRYWDGEGETTAEAEAAAAAAAAATTPGRRRRTTAAKDGGRGKKQRASRSSSSGGKDSARAEAVDLSGGFFSTGRGQELDHLFARVPPRFGRLLAFDGRLPHGVRPVRCASSDPRDARIALHGWFAPPEAPFFSGALAEGGGGASAGQRKAAARALDAALRPLLAELALECPPASGLLTARLSIRGDDGSVSGGKGAGGGRGVEWLADTLVVAPGACADGGISEREARALVQHVCAQRLKGVVFPAVGADSTVTVPLVFD
jgi:hypothetical protein